MVLLKSTIFLLLTLISQVLSTTVEEQTFSDGSYTYSNFETDTNIPSRDMVKTKALEAWKSMIDQVNLKKSFNPSYAQPSTMAALYVFGKGWIYHSSIRGVSATSEATLGIMNDQCPHMYQGNCAEMGAIALAEGPPNNFKLSGSYIAVYGVDTSNNGNLGYLQPCQPDGCLEYIDNRDVTPIIKRDVGILSLQGVSGITGRRTRRDLTV